MKRSRSGQSGSLGLCSITSAKSSQAAGAIASGRPGWPLLASWIASMESVRMVSMLSCASARVLVAIASEYEHRWHLAYARRAVRGPAGLRRHAALPRAGRPAPRVPRRGRGPAGRVLARRADVVVPLAQGVPGRARRGLSLHRARPAGLRPVRQADRPGLVLLRPLHAL